MAAIQEVNRAAIVVSMGDYKYSVPEKAAAAKMINDSKNTEDYSSAIHDVPQSTTRDTIKDAINHGTPNAGRSPLRNSSDVSTLNISDMAKQILEQKMKEINELKLQVDTLKKRLEDQELENMNLRKKFSQIKLFDHNIGDIADNCLHCEQDTDITDSFKKRFPEVTRFHSKKDDEQLQRLETENSILLKISNSVKNDIEEEISNKFKTLTTDLLSQNLTTQMETLSTFKMDTVQDIRKNLDEHLEVFNKQNLLQEELTHLRLDNNDLQNKFDQLLGKDEKKLKWNNIKFPKIDSDTYSSLKVDAVEELNMVALQNIVKRTALELNVPSDTLTINLPRINILLKEFSIMMEFICWVFQMFAEQKFDCHMFTDQAIDYYLKTGDRSESIKPFKSAIDRLRNILTVFLEESENSAVYL